MAREALPEYTVRRSAKARRVRLTVTARDGLVVVVPMRWRGDAAEIVAEKREWAQAALSRVADRRAAFVAGPDALLPDVVELRAFGVTWPVEYRQSAARGCQARLESTMLVVSGDVEDGEACLAALSRWLDRVARERLLPLLADVAAETGLRYESARVRHVRSRWGSCSAHATISLNRALVFMPPQLIRALILHELVHTLEMNHSSAFWAALRTYDANADQHQRQLKDAGRFVPPWAEL